MMMSPFTVLPWSVARGVYETQEGPIGAEPGTSKHGRLDHWQRAGRHGVVGLTNALGLVTAWRDLAREYQRGDAGLFASASFRPVHLPDAADPGLAVLWRRRSVCLGGDDLDVDGDGIHRGSVSSGSQRSHGPATTTPTMRSLPWRLAWYIRSSAASIMASTLVGTIRKVAMPTEEVTGALLGAHRSPGTLEYGGRLPGVGVGQQQDEFVATDPAEQVGAADGPEDPGRPTPRAPCPRSGARGGR